MHLLELPSEILMTILEYLSYEEVGRVGMVCKDIERICEEVLRSGIKKAKHKHANISKRIEALLPQEEEERRNHSLPGHLSVLASTEWRIFSLSKYFTGYQNSDRCLKGRVLDEIFQMLAMVADTGQKLPFSVVLKDLKAAMADINTSYLEANKE